MEIFRRTVQSVTDVTKVTTYYILPYKKNYKIIYKPVTFVTLVTGFYG